MNWFGIFTCAFALIATLAFVPASRTRLKHLLVTGSESAHILDWPWTSRIKCQMQQIRIPNLEDSLIGFRIVHITDIHAHDLNGSLIDNMVEVANQSNPDLIVLTGDYIMYDAAPIYQLSVKLHQLKAKYGVYASLGNHDSNKPGAKEQVIRALEGVGIRVLENTSISIAENKFTLVGMGDLWRKNFHPELVFREHVNHQHPVLVMSHNPDTAEALRNYKADIIFSGHTHGGTVRLPWIGSMYPLFSILVTMIPMAVRRYVPYYNQVNVVDHLEWVEGTHQLRRKDGGFMTLTVSRGVGSHPNGFRIFCPPEISVITLSK